MYRRNYFQKHGLSRAAWFEIAETTFGIALFVEFVIKVIANNFLFTPNGFVFTLTRPRFLRGEGDSEVEERAEGKLITLKLKSFGLRAGEVTRVAPGSSFSSLTRLSSKYP
jgi:hypothetical protein